MFKNKVAVVEKKCKILNNQIYIRLFRIKKTRTNYISLIIIMLLRALNGSLLQNNSNSNITAYPQTQLHRSRYYQTLFDTVDLPYNAQYNNCSNTLCYTQSKGTFVYKPHSEYGRVGTTAAAYLFRRRRI